MQFITKLDQVKELFPILHSSLFLHSSLIVDRRNAIKTAFTVLTKSGFMIFLCLLTHIEERPELSQISRKY